MIPDQQKHHPGTSCSARKKTRCNGRIADAAACRQEGSAATELVWYLLPITRPPRYDQEEGNHRTNQTELGALISSPGYNYFCRRSNDSYRPKNAPASRLRSSKWINRRGAGRVPGSAKLRVFGLIEESEQAGKRRGVGGGIRKPKPKHCKP